MLAGNSLLTEMGFAVSFGIVVAAFVMAMFFTPSLTALIGHAAWWPGHQDRKATRTRRPSRPANSSRQQGTDVRRNATGLRRQPEPRQPSDRTVEVRGFAMGRSDLRAPTGSSVKQRWGGGGLRAAARFERSTPQGVELREADSGSAAAYTSRGQPLRRGGSSA